MLNAKDRVLARSLRITSTGLNDDMAARSSDPVVSSSSNVKINLQALNGPLRSLVYIYDFSFFEWILWFLKRHWLQ